MDIIRLEPVFKQMIWGGNKLKEEFHYLVEGDNIGECWGVSAHPNGDCRIASGQYEGMTLSELFDEQRELFGNVTGDVFPLLTKIIDAKQDLSIQVHPNDAYAKEHENGSLGKTECWYILDADEDATIVIGHNAKSHEEVESMIRNKQWDAFIREIPVKKGDFFQINPGTVHAIKSGTLILETQQNSDITYRVYDYDRLSDGKPRPLHVEQSIDVITAPYEFCEPEKDDNATINKNMKQLVSCPYYKVWKMDIQGQEEIIMDKKFMIVSVIEGKGYVNGESISKGDHFIIPFGVIKVCYEGEMQLIISAV